MQLDELTAILKTPIPILRFLFQRYRDILNLRTPYYYRYSSLGTDRSRKWQ